MSLNLRGWQVGRYCIGGAAERQMAALCDAVMNANYLPAIAALAGSAVGGLTSFLATWLGMNSQIRAQLLVNDKLRREELYRDFVTDGSALYISSLTSQVPDLTKIVMLYALVSRMRTMSSPEICEEAKRIARAIFDAYACPNKNLADIRTMVKEDRFDPMRRFAELCRIELERLK